MRIAILGNSGSGKSTLAKTLSQATDATVLDLDTVAWEPGREAVRRDPAVEAQELVRFCEARTDWIIEGCYASLIRQAFHWRPTLVFLDPGVERCLAHCRERPWEPHKYASKEAQDARLEALLAWVREYPSRPGELGRPEHLACFEEYDGPKVRLEDAIRVDDLPRLLLPGYGR